MEYQVKTVPLKQKKDDWQSADSVTIGGITHAKGEEDTDHWKGIPRAGGKCTVSFDSKKGILFDWTGGSGDGNGSGPAIDFKENIHGILQKEIGIVFTHVLEDAGVYKCTADGRAHLRKFLMEIQNG